MCAVPCVCCVCRVGYVCCVCAMCAMCAMLCCVCCVSCRPVRNVCAVCDGCDVCASNYTLLKLIHFIWIKFVKIRISLFVMQLFLERVLPTLALYHTKAYTDRYTQTSTHEDAKDVCEARRTNEKKHNYLDEGKNIFWPPLPSPKRKRAKKVRKREQRI